MNIYMKNLFTASLATRACSRDIPKLKFLVFPGKLTVHAVLVLKIISLEIIFDTFTITKAKPIFEFRTALSRSY